MFVDSVAASQLVSVSKCVCLVTVATNHDIHEDFAENFVQKLVAEIDGVNFEPLLFILLVVSLMH